MAIQAGLLSEEEILRLRRDGLLVPYGYMEDFTRLMQ